MQSKSHNRHGAKGMPKTTNPKHPQLSALHHLPLDTPKGPVPFAEAGPASHKDLRRKQQVPVGVWAGIISVEIFLFVVEGLGITMFQLLASTSPKRQPKP